MALSFHPEGKKLTPSSFDCTIHRDKHGCFYLDMDGYYLYLPQVLDYSGLVELLIIVQEAFEKGFTLIDCTNE